MPEVRGREERACAREDPPIEASGCGYYYGPLADPRKPPWTLPVEGARRRFRVAIVPDTTQWALGRQGIDMALVSASTDRYIWTEAMIRAHPQAFADFARGMDILHWISPWGRRKHRRSVRGIAPVDVATPLHVGHPDLLEAVVDAGGIMTSSTEWSEYLLARGVAPERVTCVQYAIVAF